MPRDFRWFTVFCQPVIYSIIDDAPCTSFDFHIPLENDADPRHPYSKARNKRSTILFFESLLRIPRRNSLNLLTSPQEKKEKEKISQNRRDRRPATQTAKQSAQFRKSRRARFFSRERRVIANRRYFGGGGGCRWQRDRDQPRCSTAYPIFDREPGEVLR